MLSGQLSSRVELVSCTVIDSAQEGFGITFGGLGILQPMNAMNKRIQHNIKDKEYPESSNLPSR